MGVVQWHLNVLDRRLYARESLIPRKKGVFRSFSGERVLGESEHGDEHGD